MTITPYFSGNERETSHREEARRVAKNLMAAHRELGYDLLYSAASYLLRDGQQTRDSAVVAEARRRKAHVEGAVETRRQRLASQRRDEEQSPFAEIAEGAKP